LGGAFADMIVCHRVIVGIEMKKAFVWSFIAACWASVAGGALPTLGSTSLISPDPTFGDAGFARVSVPTRYAREPIASYVYVDGSILSWTSDKSTESHVVSWLAAPGSPVETTRARVTLDGSVVLFNGKAIVDDGASTLGFFYATLTPKGTENRCQRVTHAGQASASVVIESGFISELRDRRVIVRGNEAAFRYNADCTLDTAYGVGGKAMLPAKNAQKQTDYVTASNGEISILERDATQGAGYSIRMISSTGALGATQISFNPGEIKYEALRGASDGIIWAIANSGRECSIQRFDPRIGDASFVRYECPSGFEILNSLYQNSQQPEDWFGFLEDGRTPLLAGLDLSDVSSNVLKNGRSAIHRLDLTTRQWRSAKISYSATSGTPTMRAISVIHRAASDEYFVTSMLHQFNYRRSDSDLTFSPIRTLVTRLSGDFSPAATLYPIQEALRNVEVLGFKTLQFTDDKRLTMFTTFVDSLGGGVVVASMELDGAPRSRFGKNGLVMLPNFGRCAGDQAGLVAEPLGNVTVLQLARGDSVCESGIPTMWQLDARGSPKEINLSDVYGRGNVPPGLALTPANLPVISAVQSGKTHVIIFYRNLLNYPRVPASWWETGLSFPGISTRTILRAHPAGGFVAAYLGAEGLKLYRLNADVKPIPGFGSANSPEIFVREPESRELLAMGVLADGSVAAVISTASAIRTYYFGDTGLLGSVNIADRGDTAWAAGVHANGDTIAATHGINGKVQIVRGRRANLFAQPALVNDAWVWTTGANFADVSSLTVHPTEEFAYLSVRLQKNSAASAADDSVIVKFDLSKATRAVAVDVVAFYNTTLNHYFVSAGVGEVKSVDTGGAGPGWTRSTGSFKAFDLATGIPASAKPVCRFYGTPGRGPNSHFYTFAGPECEAVKKDAGWTYEGVAFHIYEPTAGVCAAGTSPVYRAYNNRFAQNDSNHRYSTDKAALTAMAGWTLEGVVFCSPQ
jgi:hypothetical protein